MPKSILYYLAIASFIFLGSCSRIKKQDFQGLWIIDTATFYGKSIEISSKTISFAFRPMGLREKSSIYFKADSTVDFPGINTEDLPCKWRVADGKLVISFDTVKFKSKGLWLLDDMQTIVMLKHDPLMVKKYNVKRDSILNANDINTFKVPIGIYAGTYNVERIKEGFLLNSPTTKFLLLNAEYATKNNIDNMLKKL
jgi:hypothetical protein